MTKTTAKANRKRGTGKHNAKPRSTADLTRVQKSESVQPEAGSIPGTVESTSQKLEPIAEKPEPGPGPAPTQESKPGRRPGSRNVKRDEVDVVVSRCKACGSTKRSAYGHAIVQEAIGLDPRGKTFTHMIARPCTCRDCGQARRDISYENHPKQTADQVSVKLLKRKR